MPASGVRQIPGAGVLAFSGEGHTYRPGDAAALDASNSLDNSGFLNPVGGRFGWALDTGSHTLSLTYTPVPEPGTLVLAAAGLGGAWAVRRRFRGVDV